MLIAHGPLGYLATKVSSRWWNRYSFSNKQSRLLYWVGFVAGIFPDIDLAFFYFLDASKSHRQFITHSLVPYICLIVIGYLLSRFKQFRFYGIVTLVFGVGAVTHVLADILFGLAAIAAPFSRAVVGLSSIGVYAEIMLPYSLAIGFTLEAVIIASALYTIVKNKRRLVYWAIGIILGIAIFFTYINLHVFKPDGLFYYADNDADGILNAQDLDIDGDGKNNSIDTDINNNGNDNSLDMYLQTFSAKGSLYDYTEGVILEVPLRFGFVTTEKFIERIFANVGIFFGPEIAADYKKNPKGYIGSPLDNTFVKNVENWKIWLDHKKKLLKPTKQLNEFDLLFFESNHVGLLTRIDGVDYVLEADTSHLFTKEVLLTDVIEREGKLISIGRVLPKPIAKQY